MVEQVDTDSLEAYQRSNGSGWFSSPVLSKTWFHQGPVAEGSDGWEEA